jgi:Family of unknown function (DUF6483)
VQQDWLLRMIQQLSTFIMGIKKMREKGEWAAVHATIEDGIGRFAGLNGSLVHAISEDDLIQLLSTRGGINLDRWWALAELMREEGLTLDAQGDTAGAERAYLKSLRLGLEVLAEAEDIPSYLDVSDLELVIERMMDRPLSLVTRRELTAYLVLTGRLDKAENIVLWAADEGDIDGAHDAHAFYDRLSLMKDAELVAGGLSRDEVGDGLDRFTDG